MMEVLYLFVLRFHAVDHQHVRFMGDRQFVLGETRRRDSDSVGIFAKFDDVVGRPVVSVEAGVLEQVEDAVKADA
ncbi:hypothetical protein FQZ97_415130 [compost metagenome]